MQSRGSGSKRNKVAQFPEYAKTLRARHLVIGSLLNLNKSAPSPIFRINPYLRYDIGTGRINIDPKKEKMLDKLDSMLLGRIEDGRIQLLENEDDQID